jgi:hypothetical protein
LNHFETEKENKMRKTTIVTSSFLILVAATICCIQPSIFAQSGDSSGEGSFPAQIFLTNDHLDPNEGLQVIRAFVPTGTLNQNCLVTMGDTSFVALGTIVYCAPRQPAGLGKGIMVSVFYPEPPPPGLTLSMTVLQQGAKRYGAPVLCNVAGC